MTSRNGESRRIHHGPHRGIALAVAAVVGLLALTLRAQSPEIHHLTFDDSLTDVLTKDFAYDGSPPNLPELTGSAGLSFFTPFASGLSLYCGPTPIDRCATHKALSLSGEWTIECWIQDLVPATSSELRYLFGAGVGGGLRCYRTLIGGVPTLVLAGPGGISAQINGYQPGTWQHIAFTYREPSVLLPRIGTYLNGVLQTNWLQNTPIVYSGGGPDGFIVGGHTTAVNSWNGRIDEFRVWSRQFSTQGIVEVMNRRYVVDTYPHVETFDEHIDPTATTPVTDVPPGWTQDPSDGAQEWFLRDDATPSSVTGPDADHSTRVSGDGYYAYVEDSGYEEANVILVSPVFDLAPLSTPTARFWVHSHRGSQAVPQNHLHVDVIRHRVSSVDTFFDVIPPIGDLADEWRYVEVDLSPYSGNHVRIRLRGSSDNGTYYQDLAVDDFALTHGPGTAQKPQLDLATLAMNDSREAGGLPASYGAPGPYFGVATVGGSLAIETTGEPDEAIVLLVGPFDANGPLIPGVGRLELGNPFPTGIAIVGDGTLASYPDLFFRTGPAGSSTIVFPVPSVIPPGISTSFQAFVFNSTPAVVAVSNTVMVSFQ